MAVRERLWLVAASLPERGLARRYRRPLGRARLVEGPGRLGPHAGGDHDHLGSRPHRTGSAAARAHLLREDSAWLALPLPPGEAERDSVLRRDSIGRGRTPRPLPVAPHLAQSRVLGSRASRTASPTKFNPTTVTNRAAPGPNTIHGAC